MSLTKATYSMIEGAPINVVDFGADPTGSADSTTAFNDALDAGNSIYVPTGTYTISSISIPNKQVSIHGDGANSTVLNTSGSVGVDIQHVANDYSSRFSHIKDLKIVAAAGTTALRINNLGTHLSNVVCRGGAIGIEYNCGVASMWESVVAYGSTYGLAIREATYNLGSQNVVWLCNFKSVSTSGNTLLDYATGLYVSGFTAFMRHCTFDQFDAEQVGTGFEFVGDATYNNVFINAWIEVARDYYGREGTGSVNTWISPRYTGAGLTPTGYIVFSPNSWVQEGSSIYPREQGGIALGNSSNVSSNVFKVYGPNVAANIAIAREVGLYPYNIESSVYSQFEFFQEVTRGFQYSSIGGLTPLDVCTIELAAYGASFVEVELVENRGTALNGYLKYRRIARDDGSSSMSFSVVDTDIHNAYCDITFTALSRTSYKITLTNPSGLAERAGLIVRVNNSSNGGGAYGIKFN